MKPKKRYYNALMKNNGKLNEIDLGEQIGLNEYETMQIISQLLSEHKIEFKDNKVCNYSITKRVKKN